MKQIPIAAIGLYRRFVSPLFPQRCKYYPSCSEYSVQAFREWGFFRGVAMSAWRILRCNPFSLGGFDPVRKRSGAGREHARGISSAGSAAGGHDHGRHSPRAGHDHTEKCSHV